MLILNVNFMRKFTLWKMRFFFFFPKLIILETMDNLFAFKYLLIEAHCQMTSDA